MTVPQNRIRRVGSVKSELIKKSREAVLAAVQIFNNPNITFKCETFIVLMIIAWTYLMHAYYREKGIEYRYFEQHGARKKYLKTKRGAYKHWELESCLGDANCPLDLHTKNNLKFLIELRHEIEHQMTTKIDDLLSAKLQACCLNYNHYIKSLFDEDLGIDRDLSFSLQFSTIGTGQKELLENHSGLPANIEGFLTDFEKELTPEEYGNERYAYRIIFVPKLVNRKGQADRVIEFVPSDSPLAASVNREYAVIKETEKTKYLPSQVVARMRAEGFHRFNMSAHTELWQALDAKNPGKGFGTLVAEKHWHWYEKWIEEVRKHCQQNRDKYS